MHLNGSCWTRTVIINVANTCIVFSVVVTKMDHATIHMIRNLEKGSLELVNSDVHIKCKRESLCQKSVREQETLSEVS